MPYNAISKEELYFIQRRLLRNYQAVARAVLDLAIRDMDYTWLHSDEAELYKDFSDFHYYNNEKEHQLLTFITQHTIIECAERLNLGLFDTFMRLTKLKVKCQPLSTTKTKNTFEEFKDVAKELLLHKISMRNISSAFAIPVKYLKVLKKEIGVK